MESLPDIFFRMASARLAEHPGLIHSWVGPEDDGKRTLLIPKQAEGGFDIRIECEAYGLYPFADGWHGAPWDVNTPAFTLESMCEDCLGFLRALLCQDSTLTVSYAGGKPYKWVLSYPLANSATDDETGLIFYNYFGRRQKKVLQNHHLPARESKHAT